MNLFKQKLTAIFVGVSLLFASSTQLSHSQRVIVAGEESPGVYVNIGEDSQALWVNVKGSVAPISAVTMTTTAPTVTNASTTILAANTARKNLLIQNNDAAGIVYLNFTTTATTAHLKLSPGQSLFLTGIVPVTAVRAIGSIASNANVVVIEGA